jgi:ring-1,2-phenylacetyl-CoA epoxidase subunit PaaE
MANPNLQFHELTVEAVKRETSEAVSVALQIPAELKDLFSYKAGQYLTFKFNINGEELRRSYSLCSSPVSDELHTVAVKQVVDGRVSTYINTQLRAGDKVWCMPPMGSFTVQSNTPEKHFVAFAAGSGITPVISILKTTLLKESGSKFTLFYCNKTSESTIFREELDALVQANSGRLTVQHLLSGTDDSNRMNADKWKKLINTDLSLLKGSEFFICGPEPMIHEVSDTIQTFGVSKEKIRFELFTTPAESNDLPAAIPEEEVFNGTAIVTIIMDEEETEIELQQSGSSVLEAAMDAGVDAPFSCQGGVCATCRAKVTSGKIVMDSNMALTDEEVEEGYVLTCQSHPASANVVVNYDEAY